MSSLEEIACSKVNFYLNIIGKRPDGYHEVETVYQAISLSDKLIFEEKKEGIKILCNNISFPQEDNLVYKAALLLKEYTGSNKWANIILEKNIPIAAGLGGGSSDAAAAIRGLNKLWKLNLKTSEMLEIAGKLGSDVPFFIEGGTVIARGRGEKITDILPTPPLWVLILKPQISISTSWAYGQWKKNEKDKISLENFSNCFRKNNILGYNILYNSFEDIIGKFYPEIENIKRDLISFGLKDCLLSGSGSSIFAIDDNQEKIENAKKIFETRKNILSFTAKTIKGLI